LRNDPIIRLQIIIPDLTTEKQTVSKNEKEQHKPQRKEGGKKPPKSGKQFEQQHHINHVQGPSRPTVKGEHDTKKHYYTLHDAHCKKLIVLQYVGHWKNMHKFLLFFNPELLLPDSGRSHSRCNSSSG
jgi:hypothetical protein